jgi:hypothetical protein
MVGTTRSRVNFFMNKFRELGFIEYNGKIKVNKSLLNERFARVCSAVNFRRLDVVSKSQLFLVQTLPYLRLPAVLAATCAASAIAEGLWFNSRKSSLLSE